jgi:hypothetical protein
VGIVRRDADQSPRAHHASELAAIRLGVAPGGGTDRQLEDRGDGEDLLQEIRAAAGVSTRTTIVLSTPYEGRAPDV